MLGFIFQKKINQHVQIFINIENSTYYVGELINSGFLLYWLSEIIYLYNLDQNERK